MGDEDPPLLVVPPVFSPITKPFEYNYRQYVGRNNAVDGRSGACGHVCRGVLDGVGWCVEYLHTKNRRIQRAVCTALAAMPTHGCTCTQQDLPSCTHTCTHTHTYMYTPPYTFVHLHAPFHTSIHLHAPPYTSILTGKRAGNVEYSAPTVPDYPDLSTLGIGMWG